MGAMARLALTLVRGALKRLGVIDTALALETRVATTSDQTAIGASFADITGLGVAVLASTTYEFEFHVFADADAATTGIDIAVNGPASPTAITYSQWYPRSTSVMQYAAASAYDANTANTGSGGTTPCEYVVTGRLVNGSNAGTLVPRLKREAVGSGPNVRAGSWGRVRKIS